MSVFMGFLRFSAENFGFHQIDVEIGAIFA